MIGVWANERYKGVRGDSVRYMGLREGTRGYRRGYKGRYMVPAGGRWQL